MLTPLIAIIAINYELLSDECLVHSRDNPDCLNYLKMYRYIKFFDLILITSGCQHVQLRLCIQQSVEKVASPVTALHS